MVEITNCPLQLLLLYFSWDVSSYVIHKANKNQNKKALINISSIQKDNAEKEATQAEDKLATTLYTLQVYLIFTYYKKRMRILNPDSFWIYTKVSHDSAKVKLSMDFSPRPRPS